MQVLDAEDEALEDFDRIFPIPTEFEGPGEKVADKFDPLIKYSFEHEDKKVS